MERPFSFLSDGTSSSDHLPLSSDLDYGLLANFSNESSSAFPDSVADNGTTLCSNGRYLSSLGVCLAIPEWEAAVTAITLSLIIVLTVVGNILVILSVFTYRPLRSAPNFFIVSLAVADLTVAVLVLPLNVAYTILGRWVLGKIICEFWVTSDVLCCTASILHLCAIAIDRYRAITDPVNYARKRTLHRVLLTIALVWVMSFLISSPPILGWNDWPATFDETTPCQLTRQQGYVIYSALGSFFIPLFLMTGVYIRIFVATRRRLRQRARASRLSAMARQKGSGEGRRGGDGGERDRSSISSIENNGNDGSGDHCLQTKKEGCKSEGKKKGRGRRSGKHGGRQGPIAVTATQASSSLLGDCEMRNSAVTPTTGGLGGLGGLGGGLPDSSGGIKGRLQSGGEAGEGVEGGGGGVTTKLSAANVSEDSMTEAEILQQAQIRHANHSLRGDCHGKSHSSSSGRGNKKSGRQTSQQVSQFVEEKQRISLSKERKAARTLGIIMGVFVVCWLPFFLMYVIIPFCSSCTEPSDKVVNFITWLGYLNSSLNPIIYTIFNMDFRKAFKKLLHLEK